MANFKITKTTTVKKLKEQFFNEFGGVLRVYQGRSEAPEDATLVSLGGKVGELECRANRTVGKFIEAFQSELGLKVKVYTKDNWVSVLDGITLATVREIPKNARKAQMEQFLAYQREEKEEVTTEAKAEEVEGQIAVPNKYKGIPLVDLTFSKLNMTDEEIEENSDELDVPGAIIAYAYDEDDDFESAAWVSSSIYSDLVDGFVEWSNQYRGERRIECFISKQKDYYGFAEDLADDTCTIDDNLSIALGNYVGDYRGDYYLDTPLLIRAKWDDHTDIFTIRKDGYFDEMCSLDEEFPELIRLTLAGENVREFPAIPLYKGVFVLVDVEDELLSASAEKLAKKINKDVSNAKYAGALFFRGTLKNEKKLHICINGKTAENAFQTLQDSVKSTDSELKWCENVKVLIDYKGYNPDGSYINDDEAFEMVCRLKMREENFESQPEWHGSACIFYSGVQRRSRLYPEMLQYNDKGEWVETDVTIAEAEQKYELNVEE